MQKQPRILVNRPPLPLGEGWGEGEYLPPLTPLRERVRVRVITPPTNLPGFTQAAVAVKIVASVRRPASSDWSQPTWRDVHDPRPSCQSSPTTSYPRIKLQVTARTDLPSDEIVAFCKRWEIAELALFGSALHDSFGHDSDVDVLVSFKKHARHTLFDLSRMEEELGAILGREVDLVSRRGIEASRNHLWRRAILDSAEVVYRSRPSISS